MHLLQYFVYKLRNVSEHDHDHSTQYSNDPQHHLTELQVMFEGYLAIAAMLPNVLFMFLNTAATKLLVISFQLVSKIILRLLLINL